MKMTMQDLIIGHYEGGLTLAQETELQTLLASSPEARAMYEHHGLLQEAMEEESERLVPPLALRHATIGAALGVTAESIGGGITAWLTSKVAMAVGTVVIGGAAAGIILSNSGDDPQPNPPAAVTAPATVGTAQQPVVTDAPTGAVSEEASTTTNVKPSTSQPMGTSSAPVAAKKPNGENVDKPSSTTTTSATPPVQLEEDGTTVVTPLKVDPE